MKFLVGFVVLACYAACFVQGQTYNYILRSYESALGIKAYYDEEIWYSREWLNIEAEDIGYFFTDVVADALERSPNEAQGAAITICANTTATISHWNIEYVADELRAVERVSIDLHNSVYSLLRDMNIKEYDLELFYYNHEIRMQEAYQALWYYGGYSDRLFYALEFIYEEWFINLYALYDCIYDATK